MERLEPSTLRYYRTCTPLSMFFFFMHRVKVCKGISRCPNTNPGLAFRFLIGCPAEFQKAFEHENLFCPCWNTQHTSRALFLFMHISSTETAGIGEKRSLEVSLDYISPCYHVSCTATMEILALFSSCFSHALELYRKLCQK